MGIAALAVSAAGPARAQTFDLAAGMVVRVEFASSRPPGAGETATLVVELDPRGLGPSATVEVLHAGDGRLLGVIAPFGARARATPGRHVLTLDEAAIDALRRAEGRLPLKFRIEGGDATVRARVLGAEIRLERRGN
jgi:hypothetical protein